MGGAPLHRAEYPLKLVLRHADDGADLGKARQAKEAAGRSIAGLRTHRPHPGSRRRPRRRPRRRLLRRLRRRPRRRPLATDLAGLAGDLAADKAAGRPQLALGLSAGVARAHGAVKTMSSFDLGANCAQVRQRKAMPRHCSALHTSALQVKLPRPTKAKQAMRRNLPPCGAGARSARPGGCGTVGLSTGRSI